MENLFPGNREVETVILIQPEGLDSGGPVLLKFFS